MSLQTPTETPTQNHLTPKPTHNTEDWSRSSFFDFNSEMVKDLDIQSDDGSDDEDKLALDSTFYSMDTDIDVSSYTDNVVMAEIMQYMVDRFANLIQKGELAPTFMDKMTNNPEEIVAFIQENHTTIGNELSDKLDPENRPSLKEIIENGIVPNKYYPHIEIISKNYVQKYNYTNTETERINNDHIDTEIMHNINESNTESDTDIEVEIKARAEEIYKQELNKKQEELNQKEEKLNQKQGELNKKDEKIRELLATIATMKEEQKQKETRRETEREQRYSFSKSNSNFSVENEMKLKNIREIEGIKNETNKLLNDMKCKYNELEQKHLDTVSVLTTMERSKIALLNAFNGEMDRMRTEIKKYNCLTVHTTNNIKTISM